MSDMVLGNISEALWTCVVTQVVMGKGMDRRGGIGEWRLIRGIMTQSQESKAPLKGYKNEREKKY